MSRFTISFRPPRWRFWAAMIVIWTLWPFIDRGDAELEQFIERFSHFVLPAWSLKIEWC